MEYTSNGSGKSSLLTSMDAINTQSKDADSGISKPFFAILGVLFATVLAVAVVSCSICLLLIRRRLIQKKLHTENTEVVEIPNPFTTTQYNEDETESSTYSGLDLVVQRLQVNHDSGLLDETPSDCRSLNHIKSCEDLQSCADDSEFGAARWKSRSHSLASLNLGFDAFQSFVRFSIDFVPSTSRLTVVVREVTSLPLKFKDRCLYTMVYLYPIITEGVSSKFAVYGDSAQFDDTFRFREVSLDDLEKATLKICLYSKKKKKSNKEVFVGQVYLKGSDVIWEMEGQQEFNMKLERKQLKRGSTSEKYLFKGMGELFLLLQYQKPASRMKVLVRKASSLPRSDKLLGKPVHYVVINLRKDGEVADHRETSLQSGHSPIWNQPFLFDTPRTDMDSFSLEFVIMRDRRYKDDVVGHVTVGPETSSTGIGHWEETLKSHGREISQWHNVMPVFKFK